MFGLGMWELLVIAVIALLALGPEKLPEAAKTLSKGIRDFRRQTRELQDTLQDDTEIGDAIRDLQSALRGEEPSPHARQRQEEREAAKKAVEEAGEAGSPSGEAKSGEAKSGETKSSDPSTDANTGEAADGQPASSEDGSSDDSPDNEPATAGDDKAGSGMAGFDNLHFSGSPVKPLIQPAANVVSRDDPPASEPENDAAGEVKSEAAGDAAGELDSEADSSGDSPKESPKDSNETGSDKAHG